MSEFEHVSNKGQGIWKYYHKLVFFKHLKGLITVCMCVLAHVHTEDKSWEVIFLSTM